MSFEYLDLAAMDNSTGFHVIMGFRSKSSSLLQKSITGIIWPTCELCPLYSTSTGFLCVLSLILAFPTTPCICFVSHQSTHTNKTQQQQQKANSCSHKVSFCHLIFPSISLPFHSCSPFALVPLLMSWLHKASQTGKVEAPHFHIPYSTQYSYLYDYSTLHMLSYLSPEWWWLQNKMYHPDSIIRW